MLTEPYPTFSEVLRARYGPKWCVAHRLTDRLRGKGYSVALHPSRHNREARAWVDGHPAIKLVEALPESEHKALIVAAVREKLWFRA